MTGTTATTATRIACIEVSAYRVPIEAPVETSFGVMTSRPAVFVRLEDGDGAFGWGEIFANWPAAGAEHRARLLIEDMADLVLGFDADAPQALIAHLEAATRVRALQCGEPGPFRQVIAGLDTALHDLFARRAGLPLAQALNEGAARAVPAYASGLHVARAAEPIARLRAAGWRAFKVKIGFDAGADLSHLRALCDGLGPDERLFADANQAWTPAQALERLDDLRGLPLGWLEEPIGADLPLAEWDALAAASRAPLAAGENIAGTDDFAAAIDHGHLGVVQPDVAKWGGVTGCLAVARRALEAGALYCPHFLGGGIGLVASAHLLAAAGGDGLLEVDANPNPLRDAFAQARCQAGRLALAPQPGLGIEALPDEIARFRTLSLSARV